MAVGRFDRIASAVARDFIARYMVAEEGEAFVIVEDDGAHEVGESTFKKFFSSSRHYLGRKMFASDDVHQLDKPGLRKTTIMVSPTVNATNLSTGGFFDKIKKTLNNTLKTIKNRMNSVSTIERILTESEDEERARHFSDNGETQTYPIGYTIVKGRGGYQSYNEDTKSLNRFRETSYVITLYGISAQEAQKIADNLKNAFGQESVLVDREPAGGHYV